MSIGNTAGSGSGTGGQDSLSLAKAFMSGELQSNPVGQGQGDNSESVAAEDYGTDEDTTVDLDEVAEDSLSSAGQEIPEANKQEKPVESSETPVAKKHKLAVNGGKDFIEIDYNDRERINKAFLMEHGARKWQAERDTANKELTSLREAHGKLNGHWKALESAFQESGVEGVIDLLEGRKGAYQEYIGNQLKRQEFLRNASPQEKAALEARELADKQARELEKIRRESEEFRNSVAKEREEAEFRNFESRVTPSFEKYRFNGKLGDENDEHIFDSMLWNTALSKLQPYEEQGVEITQDMVEKAFADTSRALRKRISGYGEKVASRTVEKKKEQATEQVQARVVSGYRGNEKSAEVQQHLKNGDVSALLKGWGKYGSLFGKK